MIYLNEENINALKESWRKYAQIILKATIEHSQNNFHQPIKPYLRFKNPANRIIAMPAYLGGDFNICGIKWIASFPNNLNKGLPRAHCIVILNDPETGIPLSIIESKLISGIRTAAVSASVLLKYLEKSDQEKYSIGISGFGPIAKLHIEMLHEILGPKIEQINVFDINKQEGQTDSPFQLNFRDSWQEAYKDADIFITCTSSSKPYINLIPKPGSLQLNVSLRDYMPEIVKDCSHIIVDDWDEICRENTDIEKTHLKYGLQKNQTLSIAQFLNEKYLDKVDLMTSYLSFHPMGMAIFDMAIAHRLYTLAKENKIGFDFESLNSFQADQF